MKNLTQIQLLLVILCFSFSHTLEAQIFTGNEASLKINGTDLVRLNPERKSVDYARLNSSHQITEQNHLGWLTQEVLHLKNNFTMRFEKTETDLQGYRHYRYREFYKGLPVEHGVYYVHMFHGNVISANGEYYPEVITDVSPTVSKEVAFSNALKAMKATKYNNQSSNGLEGMKNAGELLMFPVNNQCRLAYKFDIYSIEPLKRVYMYIDAFSGEKIKEISRICSGDAQGSAVTGYNGTVNFITDSVSPTNFRLQASLGFGGIRTWNDATGVDFTDTDNLWNATNIDRYAYDAHFGAEKTYDFYMSNFGRDSYDDLGATINVHVHDGPYVNAFWNVDEVYFGDGDGVQYTPLTSLEIVGHEITHGVTQYSAGLVYSDESGALNESYSDIMGNTIRYAYSPAQATWFCGDQIVITGSGGTPFRNLANPNQFNNPDCYGGLYWNAPNEVHNNSGVQNFWYYLVSMGGSGVNDLGNAYTVDSIGLNDAAAIAYRSLSVYLTPNSTYADARFYDIQSAIDLFGSCSNQVVQVTNAWYAVGVGGLFSNAVIAGFSVSQNFFCVVPATANFINQSLNATSYIWDFGDGDTSNAFSPSHVYDTAGVYTVTLTAIGSASCANADTVVKINYITVTNGGGPISPSCTPTTASNCCGVGITHVVFNTINKTSNDASEGYQDFTCGNGTTLTAGDPVPITITTGFTTYENVKAWIDYDNDGVFNNVTELAFISNNKLTNHSGTVNTLISAVLNTPLRMRVTDDNVTQTISSACYNPQNGQSEDYTVTFIANTLPPVADFVADLTTVNVGGTVNFTDLTQHAPLAWQWTFTGGLPASSNVQNPSVVYNTLGDYPVTLVVTNSFGTDSITKTLYIHVVSSVNLCTGVTTTNAPNGQLYDSGGPTGSYQNNENCTFLIDPGCALSISLAFTQFSTESGYDYFRAYDGTSTSDPLLMNVSGGSLPPAVTANTGKMFISWHTDGSVTSTGWAAMWSSVIGSGLPPVAGFSVNPNPPLATPVQFTDTTSDLPISWSWDFGDGQFSILQNPVHSYSAPGIYDITLIATNCISSDTVTETITVQGAPSISVNPDSIAVSLNCNDSITIPLTIYNTGGGDLVFDIEGSGNGNAADTAVLVIQNTPCWGSFLMSDFLQSNYGLTSTVITSSQIATADFSLYDIIFTVSAQPTTYYLDISNNVAKFEAFASAGGVVQYQLGALTGTSTIDIVGSALMTFATQNQNTGLLPAHPILNGVSNPINGNSASHCNISNLPAGTQVITETNPLSLPTTVEYNYGSGVIIATGMPWEFYFGGTNEIGLMLPNSTSYVFSKLGAMQNWITLSENADTIAPGDSLIIYVTINSTGLNAGTYDGLLIINSNDTLNSPLNVPVHLTVSGPAILALSDTCADFGTIMQFTSAFDTVSISNNGCDTLHITSMTSSDPVFSVAPATLDVPPGQSLDVVITFNPQTIGTFSATLTILNNDVDTVICLNGASGAAPVISTNPASITTSVSACNDSIVIPIYIVNSGGTNLTYSIDGAGSLAPVRVLAMTYGVDMTGSGEYQQTLTSINQYFTNYTLDTTGTTSASVLQTALTNKDVLLLPEQESGQTAFYTAMATVVQNFVSNGGEVVICGSASGGSEDRMYDLGLFTGSLVGTTSTGTINNLDTTNDYMDGVPLSFSATNLTFIHDITNPDKISLAESGTNDVVTYRNIGSGKAVYVGFDYYAYNTSTERIISNTIRYANTGSLPPWIHVSPDTGTVVPSDSVLVYITLYSGMLPGGTYTANIVINSNDPLHPSDTIPVTLNVGFNPCANFVYNSTPCSGIVSFTDTTVNAATSWIWDFGDGDSSIVQNPVHTYTSPGTYNVTLIACNASGCDTISYPVTLTSVSGPVAASCAPITTANCCGMGITRVQFNTIDNLSLDGIEGYQDFTCNDTTTVISSYIYTLTVTTATGYYENVRVWIDYDNNGVFDPVTELVLTSNNVLHIHAGNVTIPSTAVFNTPLRMRVGDDYYSNPAPAPCTDVQYGQFEDYTVIIRPNTVPPVAAFAINVISVCTGVVNFTDLSSNLPTSWHWSFGDGDSSLLQNPSHQYLSAGTFTVTLIATNPYGSDTLVQFVTVNVLPASFTVSGILAAGQPVQFTANAPGATSWNWDFDDGFLSNLQNPVHTYAATGTYYVSLTVSNGICSTTVIDTVVIGPVGMSELEDISSLTLQPNPFAEEIHISYSLSVTGRISLQVVDMIGQQVQSFLDGELQEPGRHSFVFRNNVPGVYFVMFQVNGKLSVHKIMKID